MVWGMIMPKWKVFLRTRFLPWIFVLYLVFFTRASIFSSVFFATRPRPCKTLSTVPIDTCVFRAMSLIVIMVYSRDSGKVKHRRQESAALFKAKVQLDRASIIVVLMGNIIYDCFFIQSHCRYTISA